MATSATTPTTYLEMISQDEKAAKVEGLKLKAQEAGLDVARTVFNLGADLAAKKSELARVQKQIPYSVAQEFKVSKEVKELEERLAFATEIKNTRFTDATV